MEVTLMGCACSTGRERWWCGVSGVLEMHDQT